MGKDQPRAFNGSYGAPKMDLKIFEYFGASFRLCLPFLHYTLSRPSSHVGTLFWSLWNSTKAQGPSWTFMDPQMDPKMDPPRLISGDPS